MKNTTVLIFFSLFLAACHSYLTSTASDSLLTKNTDPFTFKMTPAKTKTASSLIPTAFGPIKGPDIPAPAVESSFSKTLAQCRKNLFEQQLHFIVNF